MKGVLDTLRELARCSFLSRAEREAVKYALAFLEDEGEWLEEMSCFDR